MSRYIFQPFPSWRYHRTLEPIVIQSADEEPGEGWSNTPAAFLDEPEPAPAPKRGRPKKNAVKEL